MCGTVMLALLWVSLLKQKVKVIDCSWHLGSLCGWIVEFCLVSGVAC